MSKVKQDTFASVWDAIADTPEEAANLRLRSELMSNIGAILDRNDWTQTEAANHCGVTQPRINDLLRGRISRFSLDALVNIASALGQRVQLKLDPIRAARGGKGLSTPAYRRRHQAAADRVRARTKAKTRTQRASRSDG